MQTMRTRLLTLLRSLSEWRRKYKLSPNRMQADHLIAYIGNCTAEMKDACKLAESDFLDIGEHLQIIYHQASQLAQNARSVVEHIGLDHEDNWLTEITRITHRAMADLDQDKIRIQESQRSIATVGDQLLTVRSVIGGLKQIAKTLKIVAVNINSESSRLLESRELFKVLLARALDASEQVTIDTEAVTDMNDSQDVFREEAYELLDELEAALLALEERNDDADLIDRVFRAMHTLKGSGGMFGFDDIAAFTHELETVFDLVREGQMAVTKELINLTLTAGDQIKRILDDSTGTDGADEEVRQGLIRSLKQMMSGNDAAEAEASVGAPVLPVNGIDCSNRESREMNYHIRFWPHSHLFKTGTNPLFLLDELRQMGPCVVMAQTHAIPPLEEIDPEACYTGWEILLTTAKGMNAIRDVFIFVEDDCEIDIRTIGVSDGDEAELQIKKIGEILIERGDLNPADLDEALLEQPRIGQVLVEKKMVSKSADAASIRESAIAKGILLPEAELSEKEIFELIFAPGFSTGKTVTNVSGRGGGMDVVKQSIETLRGSIDVSSKRGVGTTVSLELPLTLAIIEGIMVMIGDEHYVFPLTTVEECVKISGKELEDVHRRNIMKIRQKSRYKQLTV